jgi:hypothetical protein
MYSQGGNEPRDAQGFYVKPRHRPHLAHSHAIVTPEQLVWKPVVPGVEWAVVSSDLDKKGGLILLVNPKVRGAV